MRAEESGAAGNKHTLRHDRYSPGQGPAQGSAAMSTWGKSIRDQGPGNDAGVLVPGSFGQSSTSPVLPEEVSESTCRAGGQLRDQSCARSPTRKDRKSTRLNSSH